MGLPNPAVAQRQGAPDGAVLGNTTVVQSPTTVVVFSTPSQSPGLQRDRCLATGALLALSPVEFFMRALTQSLMLQVIQDVLRGDRDSFRNQ